MLTSRTNRCVLWGMGCLACATATFLLGDVWVRTRPAQITIRVTGAAGTAVRTHLEVDGEARESTDPLPVEYSCSARRLDFEVADAADSDALIRVELLVDGESRGTGTAVRGVRGGFDSQWRSETRPWFSALAELQSDEDDGPLAKAVPVEPWELIGTRPPEWTAVEWINSQPLRLADLQGRVVLVRWFTGPHCENCAATAPALREFHEKYHEFGLTIVGMHHNAFGATVEDIEEDARGYRFDFPIAIDRGTRTRNLWTCGNYGCGFTSATFLLDRRGAIRHVHPGGQYVRGDGEFERIERTILDLLFEGDVASAAGAPRRD